MVPLLTRILGEDAPSREHAFLVTQDGEYSYARTCAHAQGLSVTLKNQAFPPGTRVALAAAPSIDAIVALLAIWRAGLVAVPVSLRWPAPLVADELRTIGCDTVLAPPSAAQGFREAGLAVHGLQLLGTPPVCDGSHAQNARTPDPQRDATILFTSGSTGRHKAVVHTFANHYFSALGAQDVMPFEPGDSWLLSLPMYHIAGLAIVMRALTCGAAVALPGENPLLRAMTRLCPTYVSLVPTQLRRLLATGEGRTALRRRKGILLGGGPLAPDLVNDARTAGLRVHTTYGCTEMASQIATSPADPMQDTPASVGHVLPYRELSSSTTGELLARGLTLCRGYADINDVRPVTDAHGWYHTGDIGGIDRGGTVSIFGRKDTMFISGGENVFPEEIESRMMALPAVLRALVVPVPDAEFGQRPTAFVALRDPGMEPGELRRCLKKSLPPFKIPDRFMSWPPFLPCDQDTPRAELLAELSAHANSPDTKRPL